tara:strand:+ start:619 stop:1245 length:627 start_codon:yes stop_codon:yes gene_type:complete
MTLDDIFDRTLVESGQFLMGSANVEMDKVKFGELTRLVLAKYSKYYPLTTKANITIGSGFQYTWVTNIPEWVSDVVPVNLTNVPWYIWEKLRNANEMTKTPFVWEYRSPTLTTEYSGIFDVTAHTNRVYSVDSSGGDDLPDIDHADSTFFQLLLGRFMQGLGRSRRAFTLNDLPITLDASELVSDGRELEQEAVDSMKEEGSWFLALS